MLQWRVQKACSRFVLRELGVWCKLRATLACIGAQVTRAREPRETAAERSWQSEIHAVIWDWGLQLLPMNEEFPVSAIHHIALITSLPFVHTARRYYRLEVLVRHLDLPSTGGATLSGTAGKFVELKFLEEVKVVTRFP